MLILENVASPATAACVNVPESVPDAGLVPMARVTLAVELTKFPLASSIRTFIAGDIENVGVALLGCTE